MRPQFSSSALKPWQSVYEQTRHNMGFLAIDELQKYGEGEGRKQSSFELRTGSAHQRPAVLIKAHTFMNRSGEAIARSSNSTS